MSHAKRDRPSESAEYAVWSAMVQRCHNPNDRGFRFYGAKGVQVCEEWRKSSVAFLAYVGKRPSPRHTLDRINTFGNYEPGNVRWATYTEQGRNRRDNRMVTFNGETYCASEWGERLGLNVSWRLAMGWSTEDALTTAAGAHRRDDPRVKLNSVLVREIKRRAVSETQCSLAKEFGISQSVISRILSGKAWANVAD